MSLSLARATLNGDDTWQTLESFGDSFLWKYDAAMAMNARQTGNRGFLLSAGNGTCARVHFFLKLVLDIIHAASVLVMPSQKPGDTKIISMVEKYFELQPYQLDDKKLLATSVTCLKLHQAFKAEDEKLQDELSLVDKLKLQLSRDKVHSILAKNLYRKAAVLLLLVEDLLAKQAERCRPCLSTQFGATCKEASKCKCSHAGHEGS